MSTRTEHTPGALDRLFWRIFLLKLWRLPLALLVVYAVAIVQRIVMAHVQFQLNDARAWLVPTLVGVLFGLFWSVISALKTRLRWEAELLAHLVGEAHDVLVLRERTRFWFISPQIKTLTGYDAEVFRLSPDFFESLIHPDDVAAWRRYQEAIWSEKPAPLTHQYDFRLRTPHRGVVWVRHQVSCFVFHGMRICRCVLHDISEEIELKRVVSRLQHEDPMTGLPNRHGVFKQCTRRLAPGSHVTFAVVDVVDLRRINLNESVAVGDAVLRTIAERLSHWVEAHPAALCVGRLVGDNFVLLVEGACEAVQAALFSEREALEQPYYAEDSGRYIPFRLGFGFYEADITDPADQVALEQLMQRAYKNAH